jgi:hypothetical protein
MSLMKLSDLDLLANFRDIVIETRERLVLELRYIAEIERRKLFLEHASLRAYLIAEHGMEEHGAERKIWIARLILRIPSLLEKLEKGTLNVSLLELALGCAYREKLSDEELEELCGTLCSTSCRTAKREIASRYPQIFEIPRDRIRPINAEYSEVKFVASQELLDQLDEVRSLLTHSHPGATLWLRRPRKAGRLRLRSLAS